MPNKNTPKPDIEYPKVIYAVPVDYNNYQDGKDEDGDPVEGASPLMAYDLPEEADDNSGMDEGEAWIAVYELKEVIRIKKTATIVERAKVTK